MVAGVDMSVGYDQTGAGAAWQIQTPHITPFSSEGTLVVTKPGSRGEGKIPVITLVRCNPAIALFMVSWRTTPNDLEEGIDPGGYSNLMQSAR
jgi:hypothetical protein